MSKRSRPEPPEEVDVQSSTCLSFDEWKTQQAAAAYTKREDDTAYDPTIEPLPDHPWYALNHEALRKTIVEMCDELGQPATNCKLTYSEISDFLRALVHAKKIPRPTQINIAVVGNQGVGKSSTINALLNRDLVDASASSSACTAFATIIEHKEGANDETDESDLKVTFLEVEEIREFIEEHIRRYADVCGPQEVEEDADSIEEDDVPAENVAENDISECDVSECDVSDSDMSEASETQHTTKKPRRKVSKVVQRAADTAEQFFRILFSAQLDADREIDLQSWLNKPELEDGRFLDHCVTAAIEHLTQIHAEEQGSVAYKNIKDAQLQKVRDHATTMWPLVKAVTISTGSVLLSNGLRFMDLPGYGDLNQTRTAVVNEYRRKAQFEIVVAKSDRYLSKTDEERFLQRAVRHHDAKNVFLVLNKADSCLETPQHQVVRMLQGEIEEPFATIQHHLSGIKTLRGEPRTVLQQYRKYLIRMAQMADGRRECEKIRSKMQRKGVRVFPVSSARYLDWLDPSPLEDPPYDPAGTGIPLLRQSLLMLPAEANFKKLRHHIFEKVTDIEDKVSRILMKFTNDVDVAALRRYLLEHLPTLGGDLRTLSFTIPESLVPEVWTDVAKRRIVDDMETLLKSLPDGDLAYQTFWLMLRNNGIATHGKQNSKNLNDELLQTYKLTVKMWKNKTMRKARSFEGQLHRQVTTTLDMLSQRLREASSDPELKCRVVEALEKLTRRINQDRVTLFEQLEVATNENYRHFTTEDDIKCPVARELRKAYTRINMIRMDERPKHRRGIYRQQRVEMIRTVTKCNNGNAPLVDAISVQVKKRQCELWQAVSEEFLTAVLDHFEEFAQALAELLENETYESEEHRLLREQLGMELLGFSKDLAALKGQVGGSDTARAAKRARGAEVKVEAVG